MGGACTKTNKDSVIEFDDCERNQTSIVSNYAPKMNFLDDDD